MTADTSTARAKARVAEYDRDPWKTPPDAAVRTYRALVSEDAVEAIAGAILEAQLWPGAWNQANEAERNMFMHSAAAVIESVLARGEG